MKSPLGSMTGFDMNKVQVPGLNDSETKRALVEIKNGKIIFKQKSVSLEKLSETLQEIVKFREMLEERIGKQQPPLTCIPKEHLPVIAKLAHESDKSLVPLSKQIRLALLPAIDEDQDAFHNTDAASMTLPLPVVEEAVKSVASRTNYGIENLSNSGKTPAALCVWRWELKEQYLDSLPKSAKERAGARLAERIQCKKDLATLFHALPREEQDTLLDPKGSNKQSAPKATDKKSTVVAIDLTNDSNDSPQRPIRQKSEGVESEMVSDATAIKTGPVRKKSSDPEKAAKEKERQEKKAAKVEKERKAKEAQNKSRSIMASFFGKAAIKAPRVSSIGTEDSNGAGPSESEFQRTFKQFTLKKDAELAPINWFQNVKRKTYALDTGKSTDEVIIIDQDIPELVSSQDVDMSDIIEIHPEGKDISNMTKREHLTSILSVMPPHAPYPPSFKFTARELFSQLTEAEVSGDTAAVRRHLSALRNRTLLPAKILIFEEDKRPGYFGTWTRTSREISPRRPFARDVVQRDYSYDSGEEWEEEPGEGGGDDVVEDAEDEEGDGEDPDSDLDSWLVDDDDDEVVEGEETRGLTPDIIFPIAAPIKRKADEVERGKEKGKEKLGKRRKVVIPLVPFARGPCWETPIGNCEFDLFKPYKIQLFDDTPYPIDPFTFTSTSGPDPMPKSKEIHSTDAIFAVPSLPDRLVASGANSPSNASAAAAKRGLAAKTTFPPVHLPLLLEKITTLATGNVTFIVESVYQELRALPGKVKKNAIEAKVREVGEKCRERKVWVVKEDFKNLATVQA